MCCKKTTLSREDECANGETDRQGCQMVSFQTKNPNLCKFCRALDWTVFIYFIAIWNILWRFGICMTIWYIFSGFGIMHREKSGNPAGQGKAGQTETST
jgi:hypothetical protein